MADTKSIERHTLSLELHPVDLRAVVEPIVKMLDRTSDRHPIGLAMEAASLVINGDAERLGRVVENLITNAIKYSPGGGAIEVRLRGENGAVALTVRDHGIGIPTEARNRLFELGYRAPQAAGVAPGLGLGLYMASEIIRRHGGTIMVTDPEGDGTMFTVRLPLAVDSMPEEYALEALAAGTSHVVHRADPCFLGDTGGNVAGVRFVDHTLFVQEQGEPTRIEEIAQLDHVVPLVEEKPSTNPTGTLARPGTR